MSGQGESGAGVTPSLDQHLDATVEFWQPLASRVLTREDAREITENVLGFFRTLQEWQANESRWQRDGRSGEAPAGEPPA
jgi:hypothetical protein